MASDHSATQLPTWYVAWALRSASHGVRDAQAVKFPSQSYGFLIDLLGKPFAHPAVADYRRRFPQYKLEADAERGTVVFVDGCVVQRTGESP